MQHQHGLLLGITLYVIHYGVLKGLYILARHPPSLANKCCLFVPVILQGGVHFLCFCGLEQLMRAGCGPKLLQKVSGNSGPVFFSPRLHIAYDGYAPVHLRSAGLSSS
ncbi:hypothetical protein PtB15_1B365 [Puccinia triticina]|nr:hypothetical protein PtB15_1B365 [Puccinia triticina]